MEEFFFFTINVNCVNKTVYTLFVSYYTLSNYYIMNRTSNIQILKY